jgi:RNA polymerase sigma factor (TIGR02999 family)
MVEMTGPDSRGQGAPDTVPAITGALRALTNGAPGADEELANLVYEPLRAIAIRQLQSERAGHTLETNGLVHEAYITLINQPGANWRDRSHFFAVAARVMRRILVDHARRHRTARRGGDYQVVSLDDTHPGAIAAHQRADELLALDEALDRLEQLDPRLSKVVECRFFAGLTEAETAEVLGVTPRTVARDWIKARGWLYRELGPDGA